MQSVRMMDAIIRESEKHLSEVHLDSLIAYDPDNPTVSIARSAKELSVAAKVKASNCGVYHFGSYGDVDV